uniref:Uncharacterized protein n=2 Tax=Oryza sativa subsp. japonica TaxID=39947 RepID=Q10J07_ORYSJ|nr:hypothetical protein [Oryza sativa Japonica Group]ABF96831.1 hypothetical protein LOC_Os03g32430 [Oryza sativa Japonica Group]
MASKFLRIASEYGFGYDLLLGPVALGDAPPRGRVDAIPRNQISSQEYCKPFNGLVERTVGRGPVRVNMCRFILSSAG